MKLNIPKIIRPLDLGVYAEEMKGITLHVWINPTRDVLGENIRIQTELQTVVNTIDTVKASEMEDEEKEKKLHEVTNQFETAMIHLYEWYSKILSQNSDESTRLSPEEIKELDDQDTALWQFIRSAVSAMIRDHREGIKKG